MESTIQVAEAGELPLCEKPRLTEQERLGLIYSPPKLRPP